MTILVELNKFYRKILTNTNWYQFDKYIHKKNCVSIVILY